MSLELLLIFFVFGMGMTGSYFTPDTRYELGDLWEPPPKCAVDDPKPEPGELVPGKGKATNLSSNIEVVCRRNIFSDKERSSYINFVSLKASRQARQSANALNGMLRRNFQYDGLNPRFGPIRLSINTSDERLDAYLQDVFQAEFIAVFGNGNVSHRRLVDDKETNSALLVQIQTRQVDAADLLFQVDATVVDGTRKYRWQL